MKIFINGILILIATLFLIAKIKAIRSFTSIEEIPTETLCHVYVSGAVAKPGTYRVIPGTLIEKVLEKSRPKPCADLTRFNEGFRVEESMEIVVPEREDFKKGVDEKEEFVYDP